MTTLAEVEASAPDGWAAIGWSIISGVEVALLCDLTRPASRDAVARLVASKCRVPPIGIGVRYFDVSGAIDGYYAFGAFWARISGADCPEDEWEAEWDQAARLAAFVSALWPEKP